MDEPAPALILASTSPSRLAILRSAGVEPVVIPSRVDEDAAAAQLSDPSPTEFVSHLAMAKANAVLGDPGLAELFHTGVREAVVIGGDSMLLIDGQLQGKPHTEEETVRRWQQQRGKVAELVTGHALLKVTAGAEAPPQVADTYSSAGRTAVHFAEATDREIAAYAATGEPFGCAGAFTLEALGGWFIDKIEGDPSSVIGLSLPVVHRGLAQFGYAASDFWNRV